MQAIQSCDSPSGATVLEHSMVCGGCGDSKLVEVLHVDATVYVQYCTSYAGHLKMNSVWC